MSAIQQMFLGYGAVIDKTITYLAVAGGGGGGNFPGNVGFAGGGGAGGLLQGTTTLSIGTYPIVIGTGGLSSTNGTDTTFNGLTCIGGGGGGPYTGTSVGGNGGNGGSGGGATRAGSSSVYGTPGTGTGGQGNNAGACTTGGANAGGGGGAGGAGGNSNQVAGVGITSSISGTSVLYARGGANDGNTTFYYGRGGSPGSALGDSGSNGVVILSYNTGALSATGGSVTTSGLKTIHTFTTNGNFIIT